MTRSRTALPNRKEKDKLTALFTWQRYFFVSTVYRLNRHAASRAIPIDFRFWDAIGEPQMTIPITQNTIEAICIGRIRSPRKSADSRIVNSEFPEKTIAIIAGESEICTAICRQGMQRAAIVIPVMPMNAHSLFPTDFGCRLITATADGRRQTAPIRNRIAVIEKASMSPAMSLLTGSSKENSTPVKAAYAYPLFNLNLLP